MSPDDRIAIIIFSFVIRGIDFFLLCVRCSLAPEINTRCFVADSLFDLFVDAKQKFSTFKAASQLKTFYGFARLEDVGGVDLKIWPLISRCLQIRLVSLFDSKFLEFNRENFRHVKP